MFLELAILCGVSPMAQPTDGDLIVMIQNKSAMLVVNPTNGRWSTLALPPANSWYDSVTMAADNIHLVATLNHDIAAITPGGSQSTLASAGRYSPGGPKLDFDGKWILPANFPQGGNSFWAMDNASNALSTLFNGPTIFVAGIIFDNTGLRSVTNTHWFALS